MAKLRCGFCNKEFKYESEKKRHELSHSPRFQCKVCDKKFSFISALKRHEKQHQRTGKVQCKLCSHKFRDESLLERHMKYAHKGKYTCNKCNREFHSELALSTHEKTHNAKSERKYHCSYDGCGKTFNFPHHLKHHESTHSNIRQYWCLKCKKGFIQHHHLKTHMKKHEPEKWLPCTEEDCKKKFSTDYSRRRHLLYVHKKKLDDTKSIASIESTEDQDESVYNLCKVCGEVVSIFLFEHHQSKCSLDSAENPIDLSIVKHEEIKKTEEGRKEDLNQSICISNQSPHINDCRTALGSCIMSADSTEDCLCAQIKTSEISDCHEMVSEPNENINFSNIQSDVEVPELFKNNNDFTKFGCEGCDCRSMCSVNYNETNVICLKAQKTNTSRPCDNFTRNLPVVELKSDGTIKLQDTFDSDIVILENTTINSHETNKHQSQKFVPYNSCKAVLGKCIVSGNGTMDEECLCAKMLVDEQQVTPEEIDEITPHPACSISNLSVI